MRGKAFALSFLAFFTVVAISPNLSTFLVSAAKVRSFSGIRWARWHNFVPAHIRCPRQRIRHGSQADALAWGLAPCCDGHLHEVEARIDAAAIPGSWDLLCCVIGVAA